MPQSITTRAALARLPVTRKSELLELQKSGRPFGGFAAPRLGRSDARVRVAGPDLRAGRPAVRLLAARAGAVRGGLSPRRSRPQLLFVPLHAGRLDAGDGRARARAALCFRPASARPSSRCRRWPSLSPTATSARRRSCKIILEKADEHGRRAAELAQSARFRRRRFRRSLRDALRLRAASPAIQAYAIGRPRHDRLRDRSARGVSSIDEGVLVEIVRPGTGDPVAPGEVGEVVVTSLFNTDYPLIRFGTGDLSAVLPGAVALRPHQRCASRAGWGAPTRRRR